jgi:sugar/nucleoside kinase (ribokinase family)
MLVCSLGDLLLDVVVKLDRPLVEGGDVTAHTQVVPGGQAANVAAWVAALGGRARFLGKRGGDEGSRLACAALTARGVEVVGPVSSGSTGVVVSLVAAEGERTMASDRGVATALRADEIDPSWLSCDHLHVSGYALAEHPIRGAAEHAVGLARERGARVSVDLGAATVIEALGREAFRAALERLAPDVVFCTEDEDAAVGGRIADSFWIVKRGARGASFDGEELAAAPVDEVVDATGAGDAFAAGWIVGGPELALEAAARCVGQVGAMPAVG